jgi:hypothetical protein
MTFTGCNLPSLHLQRSRVPTSSGSGMDFRFFKLSSIEFSVCTIGSGEEVGGGDDVTTIRPLSLELFVASFIGFLPYSAVATGISSLRVPPTVSIPWPSPAGAFSSKDPILKKRFFLFKQQKKQNPCFFFSLRSETLPDGPNSKPASETNFKATATRARRRNYIATILTKESNISSTSQKPKKKPSHQNQTLMRLCVLAKPQKLTATLDDKKTNFKSMATRELEKLNRYNPT